MYNRAEKSVNKSLKKTSKTKNNIGLKNPG